MSVEPSDFLECARQGLDGKTEIEHRMAVNRAYYAAYHWGKRIVGQCPEIDRSKLGDHRYLIKRFEKVPRKNFRGAAKARQIGWLLSQAYGRRVTADYHLDDDVPNRDAKTQIRAAEQIHDLVQEFAQLRVGEVG